MCFFLIGCFVREKNVAWRYWGHDLARQVEMDTWEGGT